MQGVIYEMSTNPQENIFEVEAQIVEGTIEPIKTDDLIVVEQFPIIKEQLKLIKAAAEQDVAEALAMECTEENKQDIKKLRTSLSKQFTTLEEKRKGVKNAILGPYNEFEQIYKECVTNIFKPADEQLKAKIAAVEDAQKKEKEEKALKYFNEYVESKGIDFLTFENVGLTINLSISDKKCKDTIKAFVDRVAGDLALIDTQQHKEEILVEYKQNLNVSKAITSVTTRHRLIEEEERRRAEAEARGKAEAEQVAAVETAMEESEQTAFEAPVVETPDESEFIPEPVANPVYRGEESFVKQAKKYKVKFEVEGTMDDLRAMKQLLSGRGMKYVQL